MKNSLNSSPVKVLYHSQAIASDASQMDRYSLTADTGLFSRFSTAGNECCTRNSERNTSVDVFVLGGRFTDNHIHVVFLKAMVTHLLSKWSEE